MVLLTFEINNVLLLFLVSVVFVIKTIGVFHGVAGVARATPRLMKLPSAGKEI